MAEMSPAADKGGKKGGAPKQKKKSTRIDMTAMVDVAFLLLTFFILTTTLAQPQTMELNLPPKKDDIEKEDREIRVKEDKILTLILGENDQVYYYKGVPEIDGILEQTNYDPQGVRKVITNHNRSIADPIIVIKPSETSRYKNMVDILDEMAITQSKKYAMTEVTPADSLLMANTNVK
jgi:biopolymer transport protein ExbD